MQSTDLSVIVEYTPLLSSGDLPRNNLQARDDSVQPSLRYPYSGQAFDGEQGQSCIEILRAEVLCPKSASIQPARCKLAFLQPGRIHSKRFRAYVQLTLRGASS